MPGRYEGLDKDAANHSDVFDAFRDLYSSGITQSGKVEIS
jgi:hypothetical protein